MPGEVTTLAQSLQVADVSDVLMTDIVPDGEGGYVREFRFYGPKPGTGNAPQVLVVRCVSGDRQALEITTKSLQI